MEQYSKYVGLDVHKDSIHVAIAEMSRGTPVSYGRIAETHDRWHGCFVQGSLRRYGSRMASRRRCGISSAAVRT